MPDKLSELSHEALVEYLQVEMKYLGRLVAQEDVERILEWAEKFYEDMTHVD